MHVSTVLLINALCEIGMGLAFLLLADSMIPDLTPNGRTTTRVLGSSLLALGYVTFHHRDDRHQAATTIRTNLLFHVLAGLVLGMDVVTAEASPFWPPTFLHAVLTASLLYTVARRRKKVD